MKVAEYFEEMGRRVYVELETRPEWGLALWGAALLAQLDAGIERGYGVSLIRLASISVGPRAVEALSRVVIPITFAEEEETGGGAWGELGKWELTGEIETRSDLKKVIAKRAMKGLGKGV